MKCEYCSKEDHLVTACPQKAGDRRWEIVFGAIFFVILVGFYAAGMLVGFIWSAVKSGFSFSSDFWAMNWRTLTGRKRANGEQDSV